MDSRVSGGGRRRRSWPHSGSLAAAFVAGAANLLFGGAAPAQSPNPLPPLSLPAPQMPSVPAATPGPAVPNAPAAAAVPIMPVAAQQPAGTQPLPQPTPTVGPVVGPAGAPQVPNPNPLLDPLRNPLLSPRPGGGGPVPTAATQQKLDKLVSRVLDPETSIDLVAGQTRVLVLKNVPYRIQAGDDRYLGVNVVNPREVLMHGREVGSTVLNLWFGDKDDPTKQETLTYLVRIYPDPEAKDRLDRAYKALEDDINRYFKDCAIKLKVVGDKLVVSGRVRDTAQGTQVLKIITANAATAGGDPARVPLQPTDPSGVTTAGLDQFRATGGPNIINLLEVAGEQQVALRVIVAEVNRAAARSIGMNFSITNNAGITVFSNTTGLTAQANALGGFISPNAAPNSFSRIGSGVGNVGITLDAGQIPLAIEALKTLSYAKSLSEPTLTTLNGQTASFLSGGQYPVPVVSGNTFAGLQGVQFVPYGVILSFTPYITDRDRIRLTLAASVSARDLNSAANIGGATVAGLNTRNVNTTVELRQGETLAVAGLIESNQGADSTRLPFIGDLPYIGQLTGLNRTQAGEKELVIFITPMLTRPLEPGQCPPLPGSDILDPTDVEFYIWNRLEGHCRDYRSPIRTDLSRIRQYYLMEEAYLGGSFGYSDPPVAKP